MRASVRRGDAASLALVVVLTLLTASSGAALEAASRAALEHLEETLARHPDDADLHWAYARRLAAAGRSEQSLVWTRRYLARWPERRADARIEIAARLLEAGAGDDALVLLDEEIAARPRSSMARFYRGLAWRGQGRLEAADRELRLAAELAPGLRAETLLVRALGLFEQGRDPEAVTLLQEILRLDPTSETALRARLLLRQRELLDLDSPWRLDAYVGFEWDDNVTLENSESEVVASGSDDVRGVWGLGATLRAWSGERSRVLLGYRFDQTEHADLGRFDLIGNTGFVSATWRAGERTALRLDALASSLLLDTEAEYTGGVLRPAVVHAFGPGWGALRVFGQVEIAEYHEDAFAYLERDAWTAGVGLEHFLPLAAEGSWVSLSLSWQRAFTQEEPDGTTEGLDGDFDHDSWRARLASRLELPCALRAQVELGYTHDRYHNNNSTHYFTTLGERRRRRDDLLTARVSLGREIVPHVRLEAYWRGSRRISNVDAFDYDKQIVGAVLRISTERTGRPARNHRR